MMNARDLQYQVERLMTDQANNGGHLYLQGDWLSEEAQAQAGLRNLGPGFSMAGAASTFSEVGSDGPSLYVRFTVPEKYSFQAKEYSSASQRYDALNPAVKLQPSALTLTFPAEEARHRLMVQPSPMRPVINMAS